MYIVYFTVKFGTVCTWTINIYRNYTMLEWQKSLPTWWIKLLEKALKFSTVMLLTKLTIHTVLLRLRFVLKASWKLFVTSLFHYSWQDPLGFTLFVSSACCKLNKRKTFSFMNCFWHRLDFLEYIQGRHGKFEPGKALYSTPNFLTGCFL